MKKGQDMMEKAEIQRMIGKNKDIKE